jgi:hypothetical protein
MRVIRGSRAGCVACAHLVSVGVVLVLGATVSAQPTWTSENAGNTVFAQAVASSGFEPNAEIDSEEQESRTNPASATADAQAGPAAAHGEGQASYTVTSSTLHIEGDVLAGGNIGTTFGGVGFASAHFDMAQNFGSEPVWLHVSGSLTREPDVDGSIAATFGIHGPGFYTYDRTIDAETDGTLVFNDYVQMAGNTNIAADIRNSQFHSPSAVSYDVTVTILPNGSGSGQNDAILPDSGGGDDPSFFFEQAPAGKWYDPPSASGFEYQITDLVSKFTQVGLPVGVEPGGDGLFTISGAFGSVTVAEGAFYTFDTPVDSFMITGINPSVDAGNPSAFPVFLDFDQPAADFSMTAVPEPGAALCAAVAVMLIGCRSRSFSRTVFRLG